MLTSSDFTTDEEVDDFQINDQTIDMVGYVTHMSNNLNSSKKGKFKKFVLSNGSNKQVQIIAWNALTTKLDDVKRLGSIVHVSTLKCQYAKSDDYNSGNVKIELVVKDHTTVNVYDIYTPPSQSMGIEDMSLLEAYEKLGSRIRVDAIIKTEIGIHHHMNFVSTVASLTTTEDMLELQFDFDAEKELCEKFLKGMSVEIVGIMKQYKDGPPILHVQSSLDIKFLDRPRVGFWEVMKGFRTKSVE